MIIDTSNALAAPGSSRGYACLSVACRSIAPPGCAAGGCPRRARRALRPPKCRHGVPPKALWPRGRLPPARREKGTASSRRGPWPAGPSGVGLPPPRERLLAPQAASGCCRRRGGGRGSGTVSRHGVAGAPRWWRGWGSRLPVRPAGAPPLPHARGASPGRRASAARARFPATPPAALAPSGRAVRARGRVRVRVRAPGTRASAATRGTPRRLPAAARSPPGLRPCRGSRPGAPAAGAGAGAGGDRGRAVRPSPVRASVPARAPTLSPASTSPPSRAPSVPWQPARAPRPASAPPSPPAGRRRRRRRRRRRLLLPEGRRVVGGVGRSVGVPRVRGEAGGPGAVGRGPPRLPLLGPLLAGSLAPSLGPSETRPQIRRGDPLNLSILVSGGKETNQDSLSNGE